MLPEFQPPLSPSSKFYKEWDQAVGVHQILLEGEDTPEMMEACRVLRYAFPGMPYRLWREGDFDCLKDDAMLESAIDDEGGFYPQWLRKEILKAEIIAHLGGVYVEPGFTFSIPNPEMLLPQIGLKFFMAVEPNTFPGTRFMGSAKPDAAYAHNLLAYLVHNHAMSFKSADAGAQAALRDAWEHWLSKFGRVRRPFEVWGKSAGHRYPASELVTLNLSKLTPQ